MNRVFGVVVTGGWLVAMAVLVHRDVVPFWSAQETPTQIVSQGAFQVAIENEAGTRVGTTWITTTPTESISTVHSTTLLDLQPLARVLPSGGLLLFETNLSYLADGVLDQFRFRLEGAGLVIQVVGERCGRDFACTTTVGEVVKTVPLDGRLSECLAETLRPFTHLKDLHIGQRWRIRLMDPFSLLQGRGPEFNMQLVTVARRETIAHAGRSVDCFRIETTDTVAWADDTGRVLRQEVRLPLLGRWTLTDETYDRAALATALSSVQRAVEDLHAAAGDRGP